MNLQSMVEELIGSGLTQVKISKAAGVSQPVVHRALHGVDIHYSNGKKLEKLYLDVVKDSKRLPSDSSAA